MTINHNELLSALSDGELKGKELDIALNLLQTDGKKRQKWQRYQLVNDVLDGHILTGYDSELTARILSDIDEEPVLTTERKTKIFHFPKLFWEQTTRLAVAASVGALAVVGVMSQSQNNLISTEQWGMSQTTKINQGWTANEEEFEQRLNTYLVDHHEYADTSGVFSYARVVSYDLEQ